MRQKEKKENNTLNLAVVKNQKCIILLRSLILYIIKIYMKLRRVTNSTIKKTITCQNKNSYQRAIPQDLFFLPYLPCLPQKEMGIKNYSHTLVLGFRTAQTLCSSHFDGKENVSMFSPCSGLIVLARTCISIESTPQENILHW